MPQKATFWDDNGRREMLHDGRACPRKSLSRTNREQDNVPTKPLSGIDNGRREMLHGGRACPRKSLSRTNREQDNVPKSHISVRYIGASSAPLTVEQQQTCCGQHSATPKAVMFFFCLFDRTSQLVKALRYLCKECTYSL